MYFETIYDAITTLAQSQGFYGRIKAAIDEMGDEERAELATTLEAQNFNDVIDMVMFFEC